MTFGLIREKIAAHGDKADIWQTVYDFCHPETQYSFWEKEQLATYAYAHHSPFDAKKHNATITMANRAKDTHCMIEMKTVKNWPRGSSSFDEPSSIHRLFYIKQGRVFIPYGIVLDSGLVKNFNPKGFDEAYRVFNILRQDGYWSKRGSKYKRHKNLLHHSSYGRRESLAFSSKVAQVINHIPQFVALGIEFKFERRCFFCNQKLTDPYSIEYGIGPECRGVASKSRQAKVSKDLAA